MIQSTFEISARDYYSCELTRKIPVRVLIVTISGPTGFGIVESLDDSGRFIEEYIDALRASDSVVEVSVTYKSPRVYWTRVTHQLDFPSIHETILECGSMTKLPIIIQDGIQKHSVLSPSRAHLGTLLKILRRRFTTAKIRLLRSNPLSLFESLLTEKQEEAILAAYRAGYYEIPHPITVSELASELGISRVAMQERLRRAENRIIESFVQQLKGQHNL
ncbi:MAG: helix-turn-helix domain-containing protein [Candidatus Thorarchaeota archaeon]|nr:helix-turn-helix domain-containing protein [Candidatus Thorarchaeota archaeon]